MKTINKFWLLIAVLVLLSPLGLFLPDYFKAGSAWGEWGTEEMPGLVGYVPAGLARLSAAWNAPVPDYAFRGQEGASLFVLSLEYIFSALLGIAACAGVVFMMAKLFGRKQ